MSGIDYSGKEMKQCEACGVLAGPGHEQPLSRYRGHKIRSWGNRGGEVDDRTSIGGLVFVILCRRLGK